MRRRSARSRTRSSHDDRASRPRGRPPFDPNGHTSSLTLPLSSSLHDQLCACAKKEGVRVNEIARRAIARELAAPSAATPGINQLKNTP